jgi:hypothetical protein
VFDAVGTMRMVHDIALASPLRIRAIATSLCFRIDGGGVLPEESARAGPWPSTKANRSRAYKDHRSPRQGFYSISLDEFRTKTAKAFEELV